MNALRRRLERAMNHGRRRVNVFELWWQDTRGADRFVCDRYPGVELTADALEALPVPDGHNRITVCRVDWANRTPPGHRE